MPYPLPLTRTEAYLAYKAGVIQQSDLKPSLAVPRNGIDAWLAYWTGLAADYPKREDGTPHILQEEEAYIAYLCGVINEYPEKCLRRVGAYLRYLISARWGRPDHPLNREELYLSLIKTQFIPSGDPSSDITIDGTAKAPFVDVKMYGDTFQQSYTGKNLLGASLATMQSENTGGTWSNGAYTLGGVTFTPVFSNGVLQRIELSGTATSNINFRVSKSYTKAEFEAIATAGETYTLSGCPSGGSSTTYYLRILENPYKNLYTDTGEGITKQMPSISSGATQVRLLIGVDRGTDTTGLVYRPQFEKSATATTYEPYVGGQASPNPDYPQTIQTVTGRQVVTVHGKNLLDPNIRFPVGEPEKVGGVDFLIDSDGSIVFDGTINNTNNVTMFGGIQALHIPTEAGKRYYALVKVLGGEVTTVGDLQLAYECRYNGGSSAYYRATPLTGETQVIPLDTSGTEYITRIRFYAYVSGGRVAPVFDNWKVQIAVYEEDDTTEYYQYSSNDYEINLGKNLLDVPTGYLAGLINGNTGELSIQSDFTLEVGEGYIKAITTSSTDGNYRGYVSDKLPLEPGKYVLSFDRLDTASHYVGVFAYDAFGTFISRLGVVSGTDGTLVFTVNTNVAYVRLVFETALKGTTVTFSNIQLERGATKSAYAAYFAPIELCKLGESQDYIWEDDGEWKIRKAINTHLFDGSTKDGYTFNADNTNTLAVNLNPNKIDQTVFKYLSTTVKSCMTASLRYVWDISDIEHIYVTGAQQVTEGYNGNIRLYILKSRLSGYSPSLTNAEKAQLVADWLASNPMKVYYIPRNRATTDTVITNQALIDQLNALVNGGAENGTTYIKVNATGPNLPGLLYVEAPKYE